MGFPVSELQIAAAEKALKRRLPDPLRSRLTRSNGGDITTADDDWVLNPVRDDSDRKRLARSANDIVRETGLARQWPRFPSDGIAVASNGGGDLIVLLPGSDDPFVWDHETGELSPATVQWG